MALPLHVCFSSLIPRHPHLLPVKHATSFWQHPFFILIGLYLVAERPLERRTPRCQASGAHGHPRRPAHSWPPGPCPGSPPCAGTAPPAADGSRTAAALQQCRDSPSLRYACRAPGTDVIGQHCAPHLTSAGFLFRSSYDIGTGAFMMGSTAMASLTDS